MNVLSERLKTTIGELKEANAQLKKDIDEKVQIDEDAEGVHCECVA